MQLSELTGDQAAAGIEILGLALDSRDVRPGYLFAALAGSRTDGAKYITQAVANGAAAVLAAIELEATEDTGHIYRVNALNPRRRFAQFAARFYAPQPRHAVAVTGTNGKTSVASFVRQIWGHLGTKAASIGTLGVIGPNYNEKGTLTTPDPVTLHKSLQALSSRGVNHVALEASSHGLSQFRLDGVRFEAAAFTNLTRDHMDYHGSEEEYFYAKSRLFGEVLSPGATAVLNRNSPFYHELENICWARGHRVISVGTIEGDIHLVESAPYPGGQQLKISYKGKRYDISLPLAGDFQAMNALTAAGLVIACDGEPEKAFAALSGLEAVPGRLELVASLPNGAAVYVDYAHTPDALATILRALRPYATRTLSVLFGCGGDRDRGKRPLMADIASAYADQVFVTDDNPRNEDASAIRREVMVGCPDAVEIGDRAEAIHHAMAGLQSGDVLVVAGKGHEEGQIVGDVVKPFNDIQMVRSIAEKLKGEGPDAD